MAVPTSLPTKELLFSKISAKYWSLFLWKKVWTSSELQKRTGWQRVPRMASAGCSALRPKIAQPCPAIWQGMLVWVQPC